MSPSSYPASASANAFDGSKGGLLQLNQKHHRTVVSLVCFNIQSYAGFISFKKAKGTGFPSNKALKPLPSVAGTHTRGLLRIITHASAPLSLKLYLQGVELRAYLVIFLLLFSGPAFSDNVKNISNKRLVSP